MKLTCLFLFAIFLAWPAGSAPALEGAGASPGRLTKADTFLLTVPLSGASASWGQKARQGAELALSIWGGGFKLKVLDENGDSGALDEIDLREVAVSIGYFTEPRFSADAPRYLYLKTPVLLPYLSTEEAAGRGPGIFFRLLPTSQEQGRFLALEILKMPKRPGSLLIVTGSGLAQTAQTAALVETLVNPPPPPAPPLGRAEPKAAAPLKPLDPKAQVLTLDIDQALDPERPPDFGRRPPELVILALDLDEALRLAPTLAEGPYRKAVFWGSFPLGFRDVGAAFTAFNLKLELALPGANLADPENQAVLDFNLRYLEACQAHPTWIAALAFDSLNLAIKAASSGETDAAVLDFLAGRNQQALAAYDLSSSGASPPQALMPVNDETLGYLP
jgi:ABC-type branched-subunit amino acid transport system substrate-binding protein